jgi:hypothetical protein
MTWLLGILSLLALACLLSPIVLVWAALVAQEPDSRAEDWASEGRVRRW